MGVAMGAIEGGTALTHEKGVSSRMGPTERAHRSGWVLARALATPAHPQTRARSAASRAIAATRSGGSWCCVQAPTTILGAASLPCAPAVLGNLVGGVEPQRIEVESTRKTDSRSRGGSRSRVASQGWTVALLTGMILITFIECQRAGRIWVPRLYSRVLLPPLARRRKQQTHGFGFEGGCALHGPYAVPGRARAPHGDHVHPGPLHEEETQPGAGGGDTAGHRVGSGQCKPPSMTLWMHKVVHMMCMRLWEWRMGLGKDMCGVVYDRIAPRAHEVVYSLRWWRCRTASACRSRSARMASRSWTRRCTRASATCTAKSTRARRWSGGESPWD
jgi:hypothetical protein